MFKYTNVTDLWSKFTLFFVINIETRAGRPATCRNDCNLLRATCTWILQQCIAVLLCGREDNCYCNWIKPILLTCPNKRQVELGRNTGVITDFVQRKVIGNILLTIPKDRTFCDAGAQWHATVSTIVEMNTNLTFTFPKVLIYCAKQSNNELFLALCMVKC